MNAPLPLSDEQQLQLARYRAGDLSESEREAFERDVLASDALSESLYSEQTLDLTMRDAGAASRGRPRPRRNWAPLVAAAALLVAVIVAVQPWTHRADLEGLRSNGSAIELTVSADGDWFTWSAVEGADAYRLVIMDDSGIERAREVVSEPRLRVDDVVPGDLRRGQWRVVPLTPDGIELPASGLAEFTRGR